MKRQGFTLVELLVVIAIIGILIALLLPAVQAAREAALRIQCTNNFKQMALSLHNYHDVHKVFPPGFIATGGGNANRNGFGWATFILPFTENKPLHDRLDTGNRDLRAVLNNSLGLARTEIETYLCPSDKIPANGRNTHANQELNGDAVGYSSYVGMKGTDNATGANAAHDGLFYQNSTIRFADITDGTSNVIALGERKWDTGPTSMGAVWIGSLYPDGSAANATFRNLARTNELGGADADHSLDAPPGGNRRRACRSWHPDGANFALADGSVRFISKLIPLRTYARLAGREDGNPVTLP